MSSDYQPRCSHRTAFSLIEFVGVVVLCSTVAALGLPKLIHYSERCRVAAAIEYLQHIGQLQQQHFEECGCYEADVMNLDLALLTPVDFSIEPPESPTDEECPLLWSVTLVRQGPSYCHGEYRLTFNESGFVPEMSTIDADFLPDTNTLTAR